MHEAKSDLKGLLNEMILGHVGCKVDLNWAQGKVKFMQPVLRKINLVLLKRMKQVLQQHQVKFCPGTPENHLSHLCMAPNGSGVGKLLCLMKWTQLDIKNAVRELLQFILRAMEGHDKAMQHVMQYCLNTANRGLILKLECCWDSGKDFKFCIHGISDSDYAKDKETHCSVIGYSNFNEEHMQECVMLLSAEAELVSVSQCVQYMLYVKRGIKSLELQVELPMGIPIAQLVRDPHSQ